MKSRRPRGRARATFEAKPPDDRRLTDAITVILFDIDGTLVLTGGAGVRAMTLAFEELFAVSDAFRDVSVAGRTDSWILAGVAATHRIPPAELARFHDVYLAHLVREIERPGPRKGVMPGVRPLLDALAVRSDAYLALLTGNYEQAARVKLEHFDLWRYFSCGAFGDDAQDRNELLPRALARVQESGGPRVPASQVVVIGDTPHDVACAAASGARSIAVATGGYDVAALRSAGADVVFEDFRDLEAVLSAL